MMDDLIRQFKEALNLLVRDDRSLIEGNASEWAIAHRLALYLENRFDAPHVDCEYNLRKSNIKDLNFSKKGLTKAWRIRPDIVVHKRGEDTQNILVVQIKKTTDARGIDGISEDKRKIVAQVDSDYNYQLGVFIEFDTCKKRQQAWLCRYEFYYERTWHVQEPILRS